MNITNLQELESAIIHLENKEKAQKELLQAQIGNAAESLKPINLLRSTLRNISESKEIKYDIINIIAGLGAGLISRKIIAGQTSSFIRKSVATLAEVGVITAVTNNADSIKDFGSKLYSKVISFLKKEEKEEVEELVK